jgi:RNA polymerase sigma-70 factor (ECF subfamily)
MSSDVTIMDDVAILERIARRDPEGVSLLYDRYGGIAFALAYRLLHDRGAAEDIVQEAFLNVWRHARTYDAKRGTVRTWLLTIVHHQTIDRLRGIQSRGGEAANIDAMPSLARDEDIAMTVMARVDREQVRAALATLSPDQQEVIVLAYFGGLTHTEIAACAALPLGTVKGRMRLALVNLRVALQPWEAVAD